ncbi:ABC transporter substrate-binding protein [Undibacterium arcticum]
MARQMKQLGMTAKLLGGDTLCSPEMGKLGGDAVGDNVLCAQGGAILDKVANGPAFKTKYKARYNQDPDAYAASYYDQVMVIAEAMQKANSIDVPKVGAEIYKLTHKGIAGTYAYDADGNMKQSPVTVYTFKNSQPSPLASY